MDTIKIGVIGCGAISGAYLTAAQKFPILEVVACADLLMDRARDKVGERAFKAAMGSTVGDSATMIFRTEDMEKLRPKPRDATDGPHTVSQFGFCIRFLDLDAHGKALVKSHLEISRRLGEQLAAHGGKMVNLGQDERSTMSAMFDDDADLSKKAQDW